MKIFQPTIKFLALRFGQKNRPGQDRHAVPNIFRQLNAFRHAKFQDIGQRHFTHGWKPSV